MPVHADPNSHAQAALADDLRRFCLLTGTSIFLVRPAYGLKASKASSIRAHHFSRQSTYRVLLARIGSPSLLCRMCLQLTMGGQPKKCLDTLNDWREVVSEW